MQLLPHTENFKMLNFNKNLINVKQKLVGPQEFCGHGTKKVTNEALRQGCILGRRLQR